MGVVYLGVAPGGHAVAVKVIRDDLADDQAFLDRFLHEVASAQRVASFCTAQVLDHGQADGRVFMVTEYIEGVSLADHLAAAGALTPGMLYGLAVGVATALVAIHAAGLIHRDLKPTNVLLSLTGPRVIDFGIARALDAATAHTQTGQLVGTAGWMAPEQIRGDQVTAAVDVFTWGCLVGYAGSGTNPFGTGTFELMAARILHAEPVLGELAVPLAGLVRSALDKEPANRPTARDLLLVLTGDHGADSGKVRDAVRAGFQPDMTQTIPAAPAPPTGPPAPVSARPAPADVQARRRKRLGAAALVVALVAAGVTTAVTLGGASHGRHPGQAASHGRHPAQAASTGPHGPPGVERWQFALSGNAGLDPVVVGQTLYVSDYVLSASRSDGGGAAAWAVDVASGRQRWKVPLAGNNVSPAVVAHGTVYVTGSSGSGNTGGIVYALDAASGKQRWKASITGNYQTPPVVAGDSVYVGSFNTDANAGGGLLYALDAAAGTQRWRASVGGAEVNPPVVAGGTVYVSSHSYGAGKGMLYALDPGSGSVRWRVPLSGTWANPPVVADGVVYASSNNFSNASNNCTGSGVLLALDAAGGQTRWTAPVAGDCLDGTVVAGNAIYVTSFRYGMSIGGGALTALASATGNQLWRFPTAGNFVFRPTVAGSGVYVSASTGTNSGSALYALNAATGTRRWQYSLTKYAGFPAATGSAIYIASCAGLAALDPATGNTRWTLRISACNSDPLLAGNIVYADAASTLYSIWT